MKKGRTALTLLIVLLLACLLVGCSEKPEPVISADVIGIDATEPVGPDGKPLMAKLPARWTLREIGTIEDSEGELSIGSVICRVRKDANWNKFFTPLNLAGKPITKTEYSGVSYLMPGVLSVTAVTDDVNRKGLLLESGETLLPCEAAMIERIELDYQTGTDSNRFLYVVYGTEQTKDQKEAFFRISNAYTGALGVQEGDVFYKGYGKIFDVLKKRFVPNLSFTDPSAGTVKVGGNMICLYENGKTTIYNSDGQVLFEGNASIELGRDFALINNTVIDEEGNTTFSNNRDMHILQGSGDYLVANAKYSTASDTSVWDDHGTLIVQVGKEYRIHKASGGLFCAQIDDSGRSDTACLLDANGQEIYSMQEAYFNAPDYEGYGIWRFDFKEYERGCTFYTANGKTVSSAKQYLSHLVNDLGESIGESHTIVPWNDPEKSVDVPFGMTALADALVKTNGKPHQLIDCFSGETLLTADDFMLTCEKYIVARNGNTYTIYELELE